MEPMGDEGGQQKQGDPLLIELVSNFPCLFDKQLKEYRNHTIRDSTWYAISEFMSMTPSECMKRWGQLRDNFAREKRRREEESRSGSGLSQRRGFSLFEDMRFLESHYQKRRTLSNVQNPSRSSSNELQRNSPVVHASNMTLSTSPQHPTGDVPGPPITMSVSSPFSILPMVRTTQPLVRTTAMMALHSTATTLTGPPAVTTVLESSAPATSPLAPLPATTLPPVPALSVSLPATAPSVPRLAITPTRNPPVSTLLLPTPATTPTPPLYTTIPTHSSVSSSASINASPSYMSDSSTKAYPSSAAASQISDQRLSKSKSNNQFSARRQTSSQSYMLGLECPSTIQATACYNKKLEKPKKTDPIESSFLSLSSAIHDHLTNRTQTEKRTEHHHREDTAAARSDEAFGALIAAELANFDDQKKAAKKAKLLKVLYEKE